MRTIELSPIAFGAFKIGRNEQTKYETSYDLPTHSETATILNGMLDLGITLIDTAPAYGLSEERIGTHLAHRNQEFFVSTKVGETFENGRSTYAFDRNAVNASLDRSLRRLKRSTLDVVFVHSDGSDCAIINESDALQTLCDRKTSGDVGRVGFSPKHANGAIAALQTGVVDVLMIEFNRDEQSCSEAIKLAAAQGVDVYIKKCLGSGRVPAAEAIPFCLNQPAVKTIVIGSLSLVHMRENVTTAASWKHPKS